MLMQERTESRGRLLAGSKSATFSRRTVRWRTTTGAGGVFLGQPDPEHAPTGLAVDPARGFEPLDQFVPGIDKQPANTPTRITTERANCMRVKNISRMSPNTRNAPLRSTRKMTTRRDGIRGGS